MVEDGPPDLGDRVRLELSFLARPFRIVGLYGIEQSQEAPGDHIFLIHHPRHARPDSAGGILDEWRVVDDEPVPELGGLAIHLLSRLFFEGLTGLAPDLQISRP